MYDLAVIGAGPGGYEAAAHAGQMGKKVVLFDKQRLGGTCLNIGCIPTKTLLHSAYVYKTCREAGSYGVSVSALDFDLAAVQERKKKIVSNLTRGIEGLLKSSKVEIVYDTAVIQDKGLIEAGGNKYQTENILIAAGAKPVIPPITGMDDPLVLDSTGALDLTQVPESLIIIGAGFIGLEFASFFADVGSKVTIVELQSSIGTGLDADISKRLKMMLERKGIQFHLNSSVKEIHKQTVIFRDNKNNTQSISGKVILQACGRKPRLEGFGAENVQLKIKNNGIETSDTGETSVKGIWACGDVTGRSFLAHAAMREGIVAVNNMFGIPDVMTYDAMPSVIYTNPEVACVGKTEGQLKEAGVEYVKTLKPMSISGSFQLKNENGAGYVKILADKNTGIVLGVHMIGGVCSEMLYGAGLITESRMTLDKLDKTVFPHPTVSEAIKMAVSSLV